MTWLRIDEVAKETGLTKRTIRYYEEIGLISPPERSEGGMRLYTSEDVERLKKVVNARDVLGFSLQELQRFIQIGEYIEQYRQGYRKAADEEKQISELKHLSEGLSNQLEMIAIKIHKIKEFKKDLEALFSKVQQALEEKLK